MHWQTEPWSFFCSFLRYLTDQKEISLNVRDKWDSTPLYYACLCGHPEVVSYLLENGARCDANTFDGERCVYGALTDQIRKMLINFSVISSRVKRWGHIQKEILSKFFWIWLHYANLISERLLNKLYVNEVTLSRQNLPLKYSQPLELLARFKRFYIF